MLADLVVSFKVFRESFGSRVTLWPDEHRIETEYLDGPFEHLQSEWRFEETASGCRVHFWVDFEFRNRLIGRVVGVRLQRGDAAHRRRLREAGAGALRLRPAARASMPSAWSRAARRTASRPSAPNSTVCAATPSARPERSRRAPRA